MVRTPGMTPSSPLICSAKARTLSFTRKGRWNGGIFHDRTMLGVISIVSSVVWVVFCASVVGLMILNTDMASPWVSLSLPGI